MSKSNPQDVLVALPNDAAERKAAPITTGVLDYFPAALVEVARLSQAGNDQHNPGQPLHWSRWKSLDHADCIGRHLIQRGTFDTDGQRHSAKVAWRALALLQEEIEADAGFVPSNDADIVEAVWPLPRVTVPVDLLEIGWDEVPEEGSVRFLCGCTLWNDGMRKWCFYHVERRRAGEGAREERYPKVEDEDDF